MYVWIDNVVDDVNCVKLAYGKTYGLTVMNLVFITD